MSDVYKNVSTIFANTAETTLYTVPTANVSIVPAQKPVQSIVKSIRVCNTNASGSINFSLINSDARVGADVSIVKLLPVAANTSIEILSNPLVLENSDILKGTVSSATATIVISVLEIS
jgi:hypothetical protein|tara:strand:- start:600 stop:956 length:357 start_codon:yes stop_codon:yes gene_type:complete